MSDNQNLELKEKVKKLIDAFVDENEMMGSYYPNWIEVENPGSRDKLINDVTNLLQKETP